MRIARIVPQDRSMTKAEYKRLDRCVRIIAREMDAQLEQALCDMMLFGTGVVMVGADELPYLGILKDGPYA